VLLENGIEPGKILQKPIEELFNFILNKEGIVPTGELKSKSIF
jgi:hypothetical protein